MALKANKTAVAIMKQPLADTFVANVAADRYPVANCKLNIQGVTTDNPEYTGTIHKNGAEVVGKTVELSFDVMLRPPVGGVIPAADAYVPGRILQASKFTENRFATGIATEALGGAGSTTTAVLGAGAAATADLYKGLLVSVGAGTYGQRLSAIRSYSAAKVATLCETFASAPTGNYEIRPQLAYQRAVDQVDPTKLSVSIWLDGLRFDLVNMAVSSLKISVPTAERSNASNAVINVTLQGEISATADEATPAIAALGAIPKFRDGDFWVAQKAVGGASLDVDLGLQLAFAPNPNKPNGSDAGDLVQSTTTVSLNLQKYLKAAFDTLALADSFAQYAVWARWGNAIGTTVSVIIPDARLNYRSPEIGNDFVMESGDMFVDAFDRNCSIVFPF
jgi:hypothetical protein